MGDRSTQTHVDQVLRMRGKCVAHFHRNVVDSASMDVQRFFFFLLRLSLRFLSLILLIMWFPFFFFFDRAGCGFLAFGAVWAEAKKKNEKEKQRRSIHFLVPFLIKPGSALLLLLFQHTAVCLRVLDVRVPPFFLPPLALAVFNGTTFLCVFFCVFFFFIYLFPFSCVESFFFFQHAHTYAVFSSGPQEQCVLPMCKRDP